VAPTITVAVSLYTCCAIDGAEDFRSNQFPWQYVFAHFVVAGSNAGCGATDPLPVTRFASVSLNITFAATEALERDTNEGLWLTITVSPGMWPGSDQDEGTV
jgi:hypothetical protein